YMRRSVFSMFVGGQELEPPIFLPELLNTPERILNNATLLNGVFQNVESVALFFDCLGSHFTWLQSIFTNFPALLNFVNKMKCVSGFCPRDFEDYGCSCRFEMEGLPVDEADDGFTALLKCCYWEQDNISHFVWIVVLFPETGDPCEQFLCTCDKDAIECFASTHINSSLNGLDVSLCPSLVTGILSHNSLCSKNTFIFAELPHQRTDKTLAATASVEEVFIAPCFCFSLSAYSGKDRFSEAVVPVGVRTTSPASSPADVNSVEVKIVPTENIPAGTSTRMKGKETSPARGVQGTASTGVALDLAPSDRGPNGPEGKVCERLTFLQDRGNGRVKKELPQLGEMLFCLTERCPEEFESYGCHCGQEGRGYPTDALDRCCFSHHCCMEQVKKLGCHAERTSRSEVVCFDHMPKCIGWSLCEKLLCACDKTAAECMASAFFNESLKFPQGQVCQEEKVSCRSGPYERPPVGTETGAGISSSEESSEEEGPLWSTFRRAKRDTGRSFGEPRTGQHEGR
uniref:Phospholipase A2-like central domain-containing protein n=1 Tax=Cairina moschata TaxID=8855 RepID=A0A8C3BCV2_CAIMO